MRGEPPELPAWLRRAVEIQRTAMTSANAWLDRNQAAIDRAVEVAGKAQNWLTENREAIADFARNLEALTQAAEEAEDAWREEGFGYVVEPLGFAAQLLLAQHARPGDESELWDVLDPALRDPRLHEELKSAIQNEALLAGIPGSHLQHGLNHARDGDWIQAWPPLIIGLEGAIIEIAIDKGLAVRDGNDVYLTDASGSRTSQTIRGVEHTLRGLLSEQGEPLQFLITHVFGGTGNPFRHGAARHEVRDEVLGLLIGVIIWLDYFTESEGTELLVGAIFRELERREEDSAE